MGGKKTEKKPDWVRDLIAVIEDDRSIRKLLLNAFSGHRLRVKTAQTGREGISLIRDHSEEIAAIIMDINLSDINGFDVIEEARPFIGKSLLVITSGMPMSDPEKTFPGMRVTFLKKPYRIDELVNIVTGR
jgi:two-component system KDP operon response regulator KdpE